jgi:hypothetical protein
MNTFTHKSFLIAGLLAAGLFSTFSASAVESTSAAKPASPTCHQETRRVAVWPHGPWKGLQVPRYESRMRFVCDHDKTLSKSERAASTRTFGPRYR